MKILFDHQKFSMQRYGGISRYFANLDKGLNTLSGVSSRIAALYSENEYVKDYPFPLNNALGRSYFAGRPNRIYKWNRRFSRWNVQLAGFDIFHPTYYDPYFINYLKKPFVVTVHDMIHESYLYRYDFAAEIIDRKKKLIARSNAIIAISEHTRQDIIKFYPEAEKKISVVHHGYISDAAASETEPPTVLPVSYLLYVGERWFYKNFDTFIQGIVPVLKSDSDLKLICAGGGKFSAEEQLLLQSAGIAAQCMQMNVTDALLNQLYTKARLFVFPSLQEGFGLPILEAFANGCPVVCSNNSCMPEVAGNAAIYFDPAQPADIQQAIAQVLNNVTLQQQLKNNGRQRLALFTFDTCVHNTLKVYQSLL